MATIKRIDHVAILVDDMQAGLNFWQAALGLTVSAVTDNPNEAAQIAFLPVGGTEVELVRPTTDDSGLAKYLEKRGPGMHHLCLEVDDIQAMLAELKAKNVQLINEEAKVGEGGKKYAFVHPKSTNGVLVELYELKKEA